MPSCIARIDLGDQNRIELLSDNIVNLNKARKAKAKSDKQRKASANSVKFGRTKAEKSKDKAVSDKSVTFLDGHKKEP